MKCPNCGYVHDWKQDPSSVKEEIVIKIVNGKERKFSCAVCSKCGAHLDESLLDS